MRLSASRRRISRTLCACSSALCLALFPLAGHAGDSVVIVGSSTVYPFATVVAERFAQVTGGKAPNIEATGTGGGMKLFCGGVGGETPDITNASRRMKPSEQELCDNNGVTSVLEVKIGYDGIAIAQSLAGDEMRLTRRDLFLAIAKQTPDADGNLVDNPHRTWRDVNPALPANDILVYGPPPTSGTRDAFAELALEKGCDTFPDLAAMKKSDAKRHKAVCHAVREDGVYVEAGENDNLIIQKLGNEPQALGIFGYAYLEESLDKVRGLAVENVYPEFEAIADGAYQISRPLYFYVKGAHLSNETLAAFVDFYVRDEVMGEDGFLVERGLIPLPPEEREVFIAAVKNRKNMPRL